MTLKRGYVDLVNCTHEMFHSKAGSLPNAHKRGSAAMRHADLVQFHTDLHTDLHTKADLV